MLEVDFCLSLSFKFRSDMHRLNEELGRDRGMEGKMVRWNVLCVGMTVSV